MASWLKTYKPAASMRVQLCLAAALWSTVGLALAAVGSGWLLRPPLERGLIMVLVAASLGIGKSLLVLDRTAARIVARVQLRGEGRCLGGFLSLRSWALVAAMVVLGRLLRRSRLPLSLLGLIYIAVGVGLLVSSRSIWRAWRHQERGRS